MTVCHGTVNKYQFWIIVVDHYECPIENYGLDVILIAETEVFTQKKLSFKFVQAFTVEEDATGFLPCSFFLPILPS